MLREIFHYSQKLKKSTSILKYDNCNQFFNKYYFLHIFAMVNHLPGNCCCTNKMMQIKFKKIWHNPKLLWYRSIMLFPSKEKNKTITLVCKKITLFLPWHAHQGCTEDHKYILLLKEEYSYFYMVNARYLKLWNSVLWLVIATPFSSVLIGYPSICRTSVTL